MCLGAGIDWLNEDDLLAGVSASCDNGHTADFEELHGADRC